MMLEMLRNLSLAALALTAVFLMGCGTSTPGPIGSKHQTQTGASETGYPHNAEQANDPQSPALSASTEQQYSREEAPGPDGKAEKSEAK